MDREIIGTPAAAQALYRVDHVWKEVETPAGRLAILKNIHVDIGQGESVAIVGASGSGKSTLLHVLGALDTPTKGIVWYQDSDLGKQSAAERAAFRNRELGFVFQFHHLLPEFSTAENVALPAVIGGMERSEALGRARIALDKVGMGHRTDHGVTTLSGGERQRAAIARAILLEPKVLLADEPTGNLDEETGDMVVKLLLDLNRDQGMTLVMVTHNREIAARLGRKLELRSGELYVQSSRDDGRPAE